MRCKDCRLMWCCRAAVDLHWSSPAVLQTEINQTRSMQSEPSPDHWLTCLICCQIMNVLDDRQLTPQVFLRSVIVLVSKDCRSTSSVSVFMWSDDIMPSLSLSVSVSLVLSCILLLCALAFLQLQQWIMSLNVRCLLLRSERLWRCLSGCQTVCVCV